MKRWIIATVWLLVFGNAVLAETFKVDPVHSSVTFAVSHGNFGIVQGMLTKTEGTFVVDEADPTKSSFDLTVQADSIYTHNDQRDTHLKSAEFLDAAKFPQIRFQSKSVKKADEDTLEVTGDLALHGVTKSITVPVDLVGAGEFPPGTHRRGISTGFKVKQADYQIKGVPGAQGDVELKIAIEGIRQ